MAASIAWVIHKEGTILHRYGYKVDIFDTPLNDFADRLASRVLEYFYSNYIYNNIYNWAA